MNQAEPGTTDPKAVELAKRLHQEYHPAATILFGSRARGDNRPDSDVDVMMITPHRTSSQQQNQMEATADKWAREVYGNDTTAHLIMLHLSEFREEEKYRNSLCTYAALEGAILADNPQNYRSRYAGPNPPNDLYDWTSYQQMLKHCSSFLKLMLAVMQANGLALEREVRNINIFPYSAMMPLMKTWPIDRIQVQAKQAISAALSALLETTGRNALILHHKKTEAFYCILNELRDQGKATIPDTHIPLMLYAAASGLENMTPLEFFKNTERDVQAIKNAATKIRRAKTAALKQS